MQIWRCTHTDLIYPLGFQIIFQIFSTKNVIFNRNIANSRQDLETNLCGDYCSEQLAELLVYKV